MLFIGGPEDRPVINVVSGMMKTRAINIAGAPAVGLLPALLSQAALLITNDSGPMHIAAAVATPVVALFGPTSATRTGPYGLGHRVLAIELSCRPCLNRTCRNPVQLECLTRISDEQVFAAARNQLAIRSVHEHP